MKTSPEEQVKHALYTLQKLLKVRRITPDEYMAISRGLKALMQEATWKSG